MSDNEKHNREFPDGTYWIPTGKELCGRIVCYRPGLVLGDFYRTSSVLIKDVVKPTKERSGEHTKEEK